MMIKKIVGKCFIFVGVFLLACAIMGGGEADAGCTGGNNSCDVSCAGLKEPNCGNGACTNNQLLSCWGCTCIPQVDLTPTPYGKRPCVCS
jgi:hypothetical protein